jgi:hypothetical protein
MSDTVLHRRPKNGSSRFVYALCWRHSHQGKKKPHIALQYDEVLNPEWMNALLPPQVHTRARDHYNNFISYPARGLDVPLVFPTWKMSSQTRRKLKRNILSSPCVCSLQCYLSGNMYDSTQTEGEGFEPPGLFTQLFSRQPQ